MAKRTLLDDVKESLPTRRGHAPWYETLEPSLRTEIEAIRRSWAEGKLKTTKTGLALSLSKALSVRGVKIGMLGVIKWLEKA